MVAPEHALVAPDHALVPPGHALVPPEIALVPPEHALVPPEIALAPLWPYAGKVPNPVIMPATAALAYGPCWLTTFRIRPSGYPVIWGPQKSYPDIR